MNIFLKTILTKQNYYDENKRGNIQNRSTKCYEIEKDTIKSINGIAKIFSVKKVVCYIDNGRAYKINKL